MLSRLYGALADYSQDVECFGGRPTDVACVLLDIGIEVGNDAIGIGD